MPQPNQIVIKYNGSIEATAGEEILGSGFVDGTVLKMKTKGVSVAINGTPAFPTDYNEEAFVDTTATYVFTKDCIMSTGIMIEVTV